MAKKKRKCDYCKQEYMTDKRNLQRGWGLCCSKSCAANKRESSKPGYNPQRVARNNIRRALWNAPTVDCSIERHAGSTSETHPLEWDHGDFK